MIVNPDVDVYSLLAKNTKTPRKMKKQQPADNQPKIGINIKM